MTAANKVELFVFGLQKFLPPEGISAPADLDSTWYEFLNNVCKVKIGPKDGVMVCTNSFSNPRQRGWSADLNEKIRDFIEKFARKKDRYSIRIMTKLEGQEEHGSNSKPNTSATARMSTSNLTSTTTAGRSVGKRGHSDAVEAGTSSNTNSTKRLRTDASVRNISTNRRQRGLAGEENVGSDGGEGLVWNPDIRTDGIRSNNYVNSTVAPMRNSHRQSQIQRDDLVPVVKERLRRFSNPLLLRILHEIRRLQDNQLWDRNVLHAPMSSYFLQEIFSTD